MEFQSSIVLKGKSLNSYFKNLVVHKLKSAWIGGEDKTSLVLGNGRPFFVKLLNPNKRKISLAKKYSENKIIITHLRVLDLNSQGTALPFHSNVSISVNSKKKLDSKRFKKNSLRN